MGVLEIGGNDRLNTRAWLRLVGLAAIIGLLLFGLAGTVRYWQAWVYMAIFFGASTLITVYLMRKDPALLERRMKIGPAAEQRPEQKIIVAGTFLCFILLLAVPALDNRLGWSAVSIPGVLAGDVLVTAGFICIFFVYRENTFLSATVEIAEGHEVISTGPYAVVRHPMYASGFISLLGTPLALGSYWAFVPVACLLPLLLWRLFDEERFLVRNLPGYVEYQGTVRSRLIPLVW